MLDSPLRPLKDRIFNPLAHQIPSFITPLHLTILAFLFGVVSCTYAAANSPGTSLIFWFLNRTFDCLDGGVARLRSQQSDLGGFLDLLGDFIVYSAIPTSCGLSNAASSQEVMGRRGLWLAIAVVEATFHVNNFVLFYVGAVVEKRSGIVALAEARKDGKDKIGQQEAKAKVKQLTSVAMRPALIEGVESALLFTVMLALPSWTKHVCWLMAALVTVGICQRVLWVVPVLR